MQVPFTPRSATALALVALTVATFPSAAVADDTTSPGVAIDIAVGINAARELLGGDPPCGTPTVLLRPGRGFAHVDGCKVEVDPASPTFCNELAHEIWHLHGDDGLYLDGDGNWQHYGRGHFHDENGIPYQPEEHGGVGDYRAMNLRGTVPACDREADRRQHLEEQWDWLRLAALDRRDHCRKLRRLARRRAGARRAMTYARSASCQTRARATAARRDAIRAQITWL